MSRLRIYSLKLRGVAFVFAVISATVFAVYYLATAANTTIGNNISTSGTLTVGGAALLSGQISASSTATSTFANGLKLYAGCLELADGNCAASTASSLFTDGGSTSYLTSLTDNFGVGTSSVGTAFALGIHGSAILSGNLNVANITATGTLTVSGTASSSIATALGVATTSPWGTFSVEMGDANPAFVVSNTGSSTPALFVGGVNQNGYVGIGTTTPNQALTVAGNISNNPLNPTFVTSVPISTNPSALYVSGRLAYIGTDGPKMQIFDISSSTPSLVGIYTAGIGQSIYTIQVSGRYAYVTTNDTGTAGNNTFRIVDVSNPSSPSEVGGVALNSIPGSHSIFISGSNAYITIEGTNRLAVIDISDPTNPVITSQTPTGNGPHSVYISGKYAYVASTHPNVGTASSFEIFDISTSTPARVSSTSTGGTMLNSVYVSGNYAYFTTLNDADSLRIYYVGNPASPILVGTASMLSNQGQDNSYVIQVSGRYVYLINGNGSGNLEIFDVLNPATPTRVGSISIASIAGRLSLFVAGRYAYVGTGSSNTFNIYDISGIEAGSAMIHSLETGNLQVRNDIFANGRLQIGTSLGVGIGGISTNGQLYVYATSSFRGAILASSTLSVTGNANFYSPLFTNAALNASSTLNVTGDSIFYGNVGIGTTSPSALFAVHGNALISGNISSVANITATGTLTLTGTSGTSTIAKSLIVGGQQTGFSDTPTKLSDPATLPASTGNEAAFSPDGTYLAIGHASTPFVTIYKRDGDTFTKLSDPATLPASNGNGVSFSPDGTYLAIAHNTTPFVTIYKRDGDTFTKLSDPATLPASTGASASFSPDGNYLAIGHVTTPFVTIYKRDGNTFTKLSNPATLPASTGTGISFSPDGTYLAITHATTPFVTIYKRSGDTFTKLSDPSTLPASTGNSASFSPDSTYLAIGHTTTPFVTIYKRDGDIFTKLSDPANLPASNGISSSFSPDGNYLAIAHTSSPFVTIYKRDGDTFTKLSDPATLPAGNGTGASFSPDGTYLAITHATTPFVTIYKGSGFTKHNLELAVHTTPELGLGFGKAISLYRSAPSMLALSNGNSFTIGFGTLSMGVGTTTTIIDSSRTGFFAKIGIGTTTSSKLLAVQGDAIISGTTTVGGLIATGTTFLANDGGLVGIGTSTPARLLSVQGEGMFAATGTFTALVTSSSTATSTFAGGIKLTSGCFQLADNSCAGSGITIGGAISGGTGNRVPYENSSNVLAESANLAFDGTILTAANFISSASTSISGTLSVTNPITGSSTLSILNLSTLTGGFISSASSTIGGQLHLVGNLSASSTLNVSGNTYLAMTSGSVGIATATPAKLLSVQGSALLAGDLQLASLQATGTIGISSTTPYARLAIKPSAPGNTTRLVSVASSSDDVYFEISSTGTTTIDTLQTGVMSFESDAGAVTWVDLPVSGSAAAGTVMSYQAMIDASTTLTVYAESDGSGGIKNQKVGVATSSPWGIFSVEMGTTSATGIGFVVSNRSTSTPALVVTGNNRVGLGTTTPGFTLSVAGNLGINGCVKSATSTFGIIGPSADCSDLAESYIASELLEPGDIVSFDPANPIHLIKANSSSLLVGIVSTNPAVVIEGDLFRVGGSNASEYPSGSKVPLALAGRVPVKISSEGGPIKIGDPITISSVSGVGKKATADSRIVGYALEDFDGSTPTAFIMSFVSVENWQAPISESEIEGDGLIAQVIDLVKQWLESMKVFIEDGIVRLKELVAEKITTKKLELQDQATGDIYCVSMVNGELEKVKGNCGFNQEHQLDTQGAEPGQ